jgi:hypothetical protein
MHGITTRIIHHHFHALFFILSPYLINTVDTVFDMVTRQLLVGPPRLEATTHS